MNDRISKKKILILAGGTGGHIFPALVVADELSALGYKIYWLGTAKGLEVQLIQGRYPLLLISAAAIRGKGLLTRFRAAWRSFLAIIQSYKIIKRLQPQLVVGMGGFASGPGGIAAWLLRKPLIIHEQNAIAGLTNRVLAHVASATLAGFPNAFALKKNVNVVGNPVRKEIMAVQPPLQRLHFRQSPLRVLVLGGSQGAHALNVLMVECLKLFTDRAALELWHQTGVTDYEWVQQQYQALQVSVNVVKFIEDSARAYSWCDLVVARAGALTVSELAVVGVASILIPFPYAVSDHQYYNGSFLEKAGGAYLFREKEMTANHLQQLLKEFMNDRQKLIRMSEQAKQLAKPNAVHDVVQICLESLNEGMVHENIK